MNFNKHNLKCPITGQYFLEPVSLIDGHVYEKEAIVKWLKTHNTSPLTSLPLNNQTIIPNYLIKNIVDDFFKEHPEKNNKRYVLVPPIKPEVKKQTKKGKILKRHSDYITKLDRKILNGSLASLFNYECFQMKLISEETLIKLLKNGNNRTLKYFIDNCIDLEYKRCSFNNRQLIHYVCIFSTEEIVKYLINKNVDLTYPTGTGRLPLHLIAIHNTPELFEYVMTIDHVANKITQRDNNHMTTMDHIISRYSSDYTILDDSFYETIYFHIHCYVPNYNSVCDYDQPWYVFMTYMFHHVKFEIIVDILKKTDKNIFNKIVEEIGIRHLAKNIDGMLKTQYRFSSSQRRTIHRMVMAIYFNSTSYENQPMHIKILDHLIF